MLEVFAIEIPEYLKVRVPSLKKDFISPRIRFLLKSLEIDYVTPE